MRKHIALLALTLLFLAGCSGKALKLDPSYAPLEEIRERPDLVKNVISGDFITTVGKYSYVKDLDDWLGRVPVGSIKFKSILRHEQEHSKRQLAYGTWLWVTRYLVDAKFALEEEKIGYFYEIQTARSLGGGILVQGYAASLSNYKILTGKLISFADAQKWVEDVIAGRWTPPN